MLWKKMSYLQAQIAINGQIITAGYVYVSIKIQYINLNFCLSHTNTKYNACTNAGLPLGKDNITETLQTEISQKY